MITVPMAILALNLVMGGSPSGGWPDSDDAHDALAAVAPEWLSVVVTSDPGWISSGIVTDLGPYSVVSTHQVVQLRLRDYHVDTEAFAPNPTNGNGGRTDYIGTNEYCATIASAEERLHVLVCGVWDGQSIVFSNVTQVDWVSEKSINGNERLVSLEGMGLVVTRGANLLALDDIAQYNVGDLRKMNQVVDALSIRAAEWAVIMESTEDPPIGGEPPLFGGSSEALAAWGDLVSVAAATGDPVSAEWPAAAATLQNIAAVPAGESLEDELPLSDSTCRATVHTDTLEGSFGCYHATSDGGIQWDSSTTLVVASLEALSTDGVVVDLGPAGVFIAHGQELTALDDLASETLGDAHRIDQQIAAIQSALDAHSGASGSPMPWVIAIVVIALLGLGIAVLIVRRPRPMRKVAR